jgi:hypothetical protein
MSRRKNAHLRERADVDRRVVLDEEERGWTELTAAFGAIPPDRFEEQTLTDQGWSPKDVMYHVAAWAEEAATVLGRIAAGTHRERPLDVDRLNDEWFAVSREMDPDVVRLRVAKARTSMREAFIRLDEVDATALEWFEESAARHYQEHLEGLRTFSEA